VEFLDLPAQRVSADDPPGLGEGFGRQAGEQDPLDGFLAGGRVEFESFVFRFVLPQQRAVASGAHQHVRAWRARAGAPLSFGVDFVNVALPVSRNGHFALRARFGQGTAPQVALKPAVTLLVLEGDLIVRARCPWLEAAPGKGGRCVPVRG